VLALFVATVGCVVFTGAFYGTRCPYLYRHAAVAADAPQCSVIGTDILRKGGSAVDAAIAACICLGVVNLHSTGIGGGGFMVVRQAGSDSSSIIDFREVAPQSAYEDMYDEDPDLALTGPLAIAVPGQLKGLDYAHLRYGNLPLADLFAPSINLAREGFPVSKTIAHAIQSIKDILNGSSPEFEGIRELLAPNGEPLKEGDILKQATLADTLQLISDNGIEYFYETMAADMAKEINESGGNYSVGDFTDYRIVERTPTETMFNDYHVISTPPPSGGAVLSMMLSILEGYGFKPGSLSGQDYHLIVEAFKLSYAYRVLLGDPEFNTTVQEVENFMLNKSDVQKLRDRLIRSNTTFPPEHYTEGSPFHIPLRTATSHLSVLAENGDAVAVTTTINTYFGSKIRSKKYGFIFNNEMADFSIPDQDEPDDFLPPGPANYIEPGKRPQSSTTPTVILNRDRRVVMVVGASGGSTITTGVAQVILDILSFGEGLVEAIDRKRLHHQLIPNFVIPEEGFSSEYLAVLEERGHEIKYNKSFSNVVQGIYAPLQGSIYAYSDPRKGGKPDGY
jgi:gamma-glutamyltranspeptidase/glutathione hydrolase/leukotriene-C4 hydrolase